MKLIHAAANLRQPRLSATPGSPILKRDNSFLFIYAPQGPIILVQYEYHCPLRGMQQGASEQAGATNGAVYRARKSYSGEFFVNFSAVKTRWLEF
jgi:hypothetical protein